ncbi:LOW QUALITY PROTEIN: tRNA endonuclease ANKZF1-like [Oculina patagonica]
MATTSNSRSSCVSLFDQELNDLLRGVRIVGKDLGNGSSNDDQIKPVSGQRNHEKESLESEAAGDKPGMSCSVCQVVFESVEIQREHFKLDWHRFNLKQKLLDKPILSEDAFEETISGEVSSISGSDSDSDSDSDLTLESSQCSKPSINDLLPEETDKNQSRQTGRQHPKVFFVSGEGEVLSVYRSVLYSVKNIPATPEETLSLFTSLPKKCYWIILMTAGGHFAGAVFSGKDVLTHKTFHRYTVRAKRGTAQGARDSQQGGKQPKSAGASLRRYNEAALLQEVQDLLEAWSKHVEQCDRIFIRTPAYNKGMFFGGKKPPFKKDDARIRTIPFPTRRPTFNEVKRVHQELSSVHLLGKDSDAELQGLLMELTQTKPTENLPSVDDDDKIRLWQETQTVDSNSEITKNDSQEIVSTENGDKDQLSIESKTRPQETSKKTKKKKAKNKKSESVEMLRNGEEVSPEQHLWNRLYCAIVSENKEVISSILGVNVKSSGEPESDSSETRLPGETSQALEDASKSDISSLEKNQLLESDAKENINRTCEGHERNLNENVNDDSKSDPDIKEDAKSTKVTSNEQASSLEVTNGCGAVQQSNGEIPSKRIEDVINGRNGEGGDTLLHVASRSSRTEIVLRLLECGADPAVKDDKGRTPFTVAGSKETRNVFRRFMASYPDRYDYAKAQIPSALTLEMENEKEKRNTERKKAQKKAQKQRLKEQKALERKKEEEEKEKKALQALSDREKRALAAEKRFAQQQAAKQAGISSW